MYRLTLAPRGISIRYAPILAHHTYCDGAQIRASEIGCQVEKQFEHYSLSASIMLRFRSLKSQRSSPPKSILMAPEDKLN